MEKENHNHIDKNNLLNSLEIQNKTKIISILKKKRESRFMLLRSSTHIANQTHFCNHCNRLIQPGEMYEKQVFLSKNRVYETKMHCNPWCDSPWDEELEMEKLLAENNQEDITIAA